MDGLASLVSDSSGRESDGFIRGLAVATVTDNRDGEGLGRVRVRMGHQGEGQSSYWARVAVPMAMADRGMFFLPEVGDQVLVGFEMGNPSNPYVLGSLWNGDSRPPADNADGNNDVRVLRTRSETELRFDDGAQPSVEIKLKDEKKVRLDDQGITLDDGKGNVLKIETNSGSISIESTAELKLKAPMVSVSADGAMELKAGGTMTIQGTLVQIN